MPTPEETVLDHVLDGFSSEDLEKIAAWIQLQARLKRRNTGDIMSAEDIAQKLCQEAEDR